MSVTTTPRIGGSRLSAERIAEVDAAGMVQAILDQPRHLCEAVFRARNACIAAADRPGGMLACGMGGSAIGADLAAAIVGDRARRPLRTVRDYTVEPWLGPDTLVVCASYSGNTEETLACYAAARRAGAPIVAVTTGGALDALARADGVPVIEVPAGMQPRAAVCHMTVAFLHCADRCGAAPDVTRDVRPAAAALRRRGREWGPESADRSLAKALALRLENTLPVVYGAGATAPVALRWKAQLNENAKLPAFHGALPEIDHNEICAWEDPPLPPRMSAVFLEDPEQHRRIRDRIGLTAEAVGRGAAHVERVRTAGRSRLERVTTLVMLGDLVSVYSAVLRGVDPTPVDPIERFKDALAAR